MAAQRRHCPIYDFNCDLVAAVKISSGAELIE
jgi:hypothetical protein